MDQKTQFGLLQKEFLHGFAPKYLAGFYEGELSVLLPSNFRETIGAFLLQFYIPWRGKFFYEHNPKGENVLSSSLKFFLQWKFGYQMIRNASMQNFHAFPFETSIQKGLTDRKKVLQLNYDLPYNPSLVRKVVDELVSVGKNSYLGKTYLFDNGGFRIVAFFRLKNGHLNGR